QYAVETAAERYRRTLELLELDGQTDGRQHCEVLLALGIADLGSARYENARSALRQAAAEAEGAGFLDLMAEAVYQFEVAVTFPGLPGDEVVDLCRRAADRLGDDDSVER